MSSIIGNTHVSYFESPQAFGETIRPYIESVLR
jgi:hypothetical protein